MLKVTTYEKRISEYPIQQQWAVNDGDLSLVETGMEITPSVSGFDLKELNKSFEYRESKPDLPYDFVVNGYIKPEDPESPTTNENKYYMNSIKIKGKGDDVWEKFYKVQNIYGDDWGLVVSSGIIGYLISDNDIIDVDCSNETIIGSIANETYVDNIKNVYCRDTVTRWGRLQRVLVPENEITLDSMRDNIAKKSNTAWTASYMEFKQKQVEIFSINKIIHRFWEGVVISPSLVAEEVTSDSCPDISTYDSWLLPCVVEQKKDLLPLIGLALK